MKCLQQFLVKLVSSLVRFYVNFFFEMNSFESLSPALASRKWWEGGLSQSFCDSRPALLFPFNQLPTQRSL